jgi:hypothetical protein
MLQCIGNCSDKEQPGPWERNPNAEVAQQLEHVNEAVPVPLSTAQCAKLQDMYFRIFSSTVQELQKYFSYFNM